LRDLGIAIVRGRDIAATDTFDAPPVAVLSEASASRLWPGQDPVGRQVRTNPTSPPITIVGVAADARHRGRFRFSEGAAAHEPQLDIYLPFEQRPNSLLTIGVRTVADPRQSTRAVIAAVAAMDPTLAVSDVAPLDERLHAEQSSVGFAALLMNVYGGLALLLAAIGVYGVLAAAVAARRRELAIRSALGASPERLLHAVLREGLMVTGASILCGVTLTAALGRTVNAWLFGVSATDPLLLAGAAGLLFATALGASAIPARQAARVDPARLLRGEP
jgi:hypothetical protein